MAQVKGTLWFGTNITDEALQKADQLRRQLEEKFAKEINVKVNVEGLEKVGQQSQRVQQQISELGKSLNSQNVNLTGVRAIQAQMVELADKIRRAKEDYDAFTKLANESKRKGDLFGAQQMEAAAARARGILSQYNNEYSRLSKSAELAKLQERELTLQTRETAKAHRETEQAMRRRNAAYAHLNSNMKASIGISGELTAGLAGMYSVYKAKEFLDNVIAIGGQLEQQRVSIGAILHDTAHANELFGRIKSLALQSPFGVLDLDKYTKQLSAYGFQYNELFDMTKRLADISAGAGTDISRLALALGHVRSATYLTGITLRQFSMNNIPMLKMLSEYYSQLEKRIVTTAEVQKRISSRDVGYEDVIEVIKRMTDVGGQFYNMQAVMADTLAGKWKNLKDAVDLMYGEIGESWVGDKLKGVAEILTALTKRWRQMIPIITAATVALGAYKTAMMLSNAHITTGARGLVAFRGALHSLGATLHTITPYFAAFAAISFGLEAIQHYKMQAEQAGEAAKEAFRKGEEGVKNLNDAISKLQSPAIKMSEDAYTQGISNIEQYLKDYSVRASEIINEANRVDENGEHVYSLAEKYKYLYEQMLQTIKVYEEMKRTSDVGKNALLNTGGFLNDNVTTDIADYMKARKQWNEDMNKYYAENEKFVQEYIDNARKEDEAFANTTKNMKNYADMFKLLIQRSNEFSIAYRGIRDRMAEYSFMWNEVNIQFREAQKEVKNYIEGMKTDLKAQNYDFENLDPIQTDNIRQKIKDFLNSEEMSTLDDFHRRFFEKQMLAEFNLKIITNAVETSQELEAWQLEMQKYFETHGIKIPISPEDTPETIAKKAKELRDKYQEEINNSGKVLINLGFRLDRLPVSKPSDLAPWGGMHFDRYKEDTEKINNLNEAVKAFGLTLDKENKKSKKTGTGGTKKDAELEKWQLRVQALKDFYAEWNALRKELGRTDAYKEILKSGLMPDMFNKDGTPKYDLDNYAAELGRLESALSGTTDARRKAKQSLKKDQFKEITANAKESADKVMAELQKAMEKASRQWNLYKSIYEKTGDKNGAMQLVFGNTENLRKGIEDAKSYWRSMVKSVAGSVNPEDLDGLTDTELADKFGSGWKKVKEYRDEYLKAFRADADEEERIYLELVDAAMTYADKLAAIESKRIKEINAAKGDKSLIYAANKRAQESISNVDFEKLQQRINWDVVFSNLDTYTKDVLVKVRKQLKDYLRLNRTNMSVKDIKEMSTAINNINNAIQKEEGLFGGLRDAQRELTEATKDLLSAQVDYNAAIELYGEGSKQAEDALKRLNEAQNGVVTAQGGVNQAKNDTISSITTVMNAFASLGKSSDTSLSEVGSAIGGVVTALSKSGSKIGTIIAAIFSLLDSIGEKGIGNFAANIAGSLGNALVGANEWNPFNYIFSKKTFMGKFLGAELLRPADYREYKKAVEQYENLIGVWDTLIDRKNTYLSQSWGAEANRAAKEARDILQAQIEATKAIANVRLGSGASTGSHSIGYRMWQGSYGYEGQNWKDVAKEAEKGMKAAGLGDVTFESMEDMTRMTAEQLEYLMKNYTGLWANMDDDFKEYLEKLIEYSRNADEQIEKLKEKITGWNFKSLSDSWANALSNMSNSATNLFEDFEDGLREAIINAMVSNIYSGEMKGLVNGLADAAQNELYTDVSGNVKKHTYDANGNVTDTDVLSEYTQAEYANIKAVAENLAEREAASRDLLASLYGWESGDSGSSSASQVLSGLSEADQGLFMSYVNAIRADVSIERTLMERMTLQIETMFPSYGQTIAEHTTLLRNIDANTMRSAVSSEAIQLFCQKIENGDITVKVK